MTSRAAAPPDRDRIQHEADAYGAWLSVVLGERWSVSFGRARRVPVQARRSRRGAELRLHHMFVDAPEDVREALGRWLLVGRRARRACERLDTWIHAQLAATPTQRRRVRLSPEGDVHDLAPLVRALLETEFSADFDATRPAPGVTWGRRAASRSRHSLRLGSYEPEAHVVRMHPVLDQAGVPEWFVRFVLKHELLHAVHPPTREPNGRWVLHGPEFQQRERAWPEFRAAEAWERENLPRLIRSARDGSRLQARAAEVAGTA